MKRILVVHGGEPESLASPFWKYGIMLGTPAVPVWD